MYKTNMCECVRWLGVVSKWTATLKYYSFKLTWFIEKTMLYSMVSIKTMLEHVIQTEYKYQVQTRNISDITLTSGNGWIFSDMSDFSPCSTLESVECTCPTVSGQSICHSVWRSVMAQVQSGQSVRYMHIPWSPAILINICTYTCYTCTYIC